MPSNDSKNDEEGENTKEELVTDWKRIGYKYMTVRTTTCRRPGLHMMCLICLYRRLSRLSDMLKYVMIPCIHVGVKRAFFSSTFCQQRPWTLFFSQRHAHQQVQHHQ